MDAIGLRKRQLFQLRQRSASSLFRSHEEGPADAGRTGFSEIQMGQDATKTDKRITLMEREHKDVHSFLGAIQTSLAVVMIVEKMDCSPLS